MSLYRIYTSLDCARAIARVGVIFGNGNQSLYPIGLFTIMRFWRWCSVMIHSHYSHLSFFTKDDKSCSAKSSLPFYSQCDFKTYVKYQLATKVLSLLFTSADFQCTSGDKKTFCTRLYIIQCPHVLCKVFAWRHPKPHYSHGTAFTYTRPSSKESTKNTRAARVQRDYI